MLLPFAEKVHIDDQKLAGYCLSETHVTGKHKALVFKSALGITAENYLVLKDAIQNAVLMNDAEYGGMNQHGDIYVVDFLMKYYEKRATVRTAWLVRFGESFPRLVSCYVKNK